jgi:hypothetical protein
MHGRRLRFALGDGGCLAHRRNKLLCNILPLHGLIFFMV